MKDLVERMITDYKKNVQRMEHLAIEQKAFVPLSEDETLDFLCYPGQKEPDVRVCKDVDLEKTFKIAVSYKSICKGLNDEVSRELAQEYGRLARQVAFVDYAVRILPRKYKQLMTMQVLEGRTWTELCEAFDVSGVGLMRLKRKAVDLMANYLGKRYDSFGFRKEDFDEQCEDLI